MKPQQLSSLIPRCTLNTRINNASILSRSLSTCSRRTLRSRAFHPLSGEMSFSRSYAQIVPSPSTKGISQTEYDLRRTLLAESLPDGSVCVIVGASMKYSSDSVLCVSHKVFVNINRSYPFLQDPNFFYLTGFVEKNALAVIRKSFPRERDQLTCRKG